MDIATALTLARAASVTTASIFVVLESFAGNTGAVLSQNAPHFLNTLLQGYFRAIQLGGPLENAVRQVWQIFLYAGDPEVQVDFVVVGCN